MPSRQSARDLPDCVLIIDPRVGLIFALAGRLVKRGSVSVVLGGLIEDRVHGGGHAIILGVGRRAVGMSWSNELDIAVRAARLAAETALRLQPGIVVESKADQSPVTPADRECERLIARIL